MQYHVVTVAASGIRRVGRRQLSHFHSQRVAGESRFGARSVFGHGTHRRLQRNRSVRSCRFLEFTESFESYRLHFGFRENIIEDTPRQKSQPIKSFFSSLRSSPSQQRKNTDVSKPTTSAATSGGSSSNRDASPINSIKGKRTAASSSTPERPKKLSSSQDPEAACNKSKVRLANTIAASRSTVL